jgi:hypothetical protein
LTDETSAVEASRESPDDAKDKAELVTQWLDAIAVASDDEKAWRKRAEDVVKIYRQGSTNRLGNGESIGDNDRTFNILHANVETIVPSIYNSTPSPDVRRRFNDSDPVGKQVADILERALSHSVDSYDFDAAIRATVYDMELPGRGLDRVRYVPYLSPDEKSVAYEEVQCEHIPWKHFRHGPARMWGDVPWIAFELFLTRDELVKLSPNLGSKVEMDAAIERADKKDGQNLPDIYKHARVWEIWDKDSKKIIFIATGYKDKPIREEDDPLGLTGFFPVPRPLYAIETSDTLVPVTPYSIYQDQAEELERVSRRIMALVEQVKVRAVYDGTLGGPIATLSEAEDGALIPLENVANYATSGPKALENAFAWWPMDGAIIALKQLYEQREQIKAAIYEITGIADIMRGQTDANETLGAQQIKTQWGSLRVQRKQAEVQRYVRDLFRLKAEIIATKFKPETIQMMTGIMFMGTPIEQQVIQLLRSDTMRGYRVDVESDSTIRADLTRNQQNMNMFLQGTAQYGAAMGPIVQEMPGAMESVVQIYQAFARNFKLGKQAEDVIEKLGETAKQAAQQPKPNPEMEKAKMQMQLEQAKLQMQQQADQAKLQIEQAKMQLEQAKAEQAAQLAQAKLQGEMQMKQMELEANIALEREKAHAQMQIDREKASQDMQMRREEMTMNAQSQRESAELDAQVKTQNSTRELDFKDQLSRREMAAQGVKVGDEGDIKAAAEVAAEQANKLTERTLELTTKLTAALDALAKSNTAPRRAVRGPDGRISHSEMMQ